MTTAVEDEQYADELLGEKLKSKYRLTVAAIAVFLATGCAPEALTTSQACDIWHDLEDNRPYNDALATAEYDLGHYRDLAYRIDGRLGQAFSDLIAVQQAAVNHGGEIQDEDLELYAEATGEVIRICGHPWTN